MGITKSDEFSILHAECDDDIHALKDRINELEKAARAVVEHPGFDEIKNDDFGIRLDDLAMTLNDRACDDSAEEK